MNFYLWYELSGANKSRAFQRVHGVSARSQSTTPNTALAALAVANLSRLHNNVNFSHNGKLRSCSALHEAPNCQEF
jgi:hypothetical protein